MTNLLNVIWPAIYVNETFWKFWYLIIATIIIELFVLKHFLSLSWTKSFFASLIGNIISGIVGTFVMKYGMLGWHLIADIFLLGTFSLVNWIMTYIIMCLGSVLIETKTVSLIYNIGIKRLFIPMLTGNLLSYIFIAFAFTTSAKEDEIVKKERILFISDKKEFTLLDGGILSVDTAFIEIWYNKANERKDNANPKFRLQLPFNKKAPEIYNASFRLLDEGSSVGIFENRQQLFVDSIKDEFILVLEQKNLDSNLGWRVPIETDTFKLKRIKMCE